MKKIVLMALALVPLSFMHGQNFTDVLRYSQDYTLGTARYSAMSGAFSALGGDMAAIGLNPASSAIFLNNQLSISGATYGQNQNSYLNGTVSSSDNLDFNISNAGGVFIFENYNEGSRWLKFSVGLTYNQSGAFENEVIAGGNTAATIGNIFRTQANGIALSNLQTMGGESISDLYAYLGEVEGSSAQNAFLGYQGYIIDPLEDSPNNTSYISNTGSGSFRHDYFLYTDGFAGKYTFNASAQYTENFYFGLNINTHSVEYQEASIYIERNSNPNSSIKRIDFENYLNVFGDGFSFQLGGIAKLNDALRVSLYYDSPTWYTLSEETSQYLETNRLDEGVTITSVVDPRIINIYQEYTLRTPYKIGAGAAYVFGGYGLISVDYSYKDYSSAKLRPGNDPYFASQNETINSLLTGSSTLNVGGEYRWKFMSFRGGFHYEQSPFSDTEMMGDRTGFSLGLGYNGGDYTFDIAYAYAQQDRQQSILSVTNFNRSTDFENIILSLNVNL